MNEPQAMAKRIPEVEAAKKPAPELPASLAAWSGDAFRPTLLAEMGKLSADELGLDRAASPGAFAREGEIRVIVLGAGEEPGRIIARIGVFFTQVMASYCCDGEEPMESDAYCEMEVAIDKTSAQAQFRLTSAP